MRENQSMLDFFSPELKKNGLSPSDMTILDRSDLWTCGFIFYRMFYGENPNFDDTARAIFPRNKIISEKL
jgi:hypothetical protein